MDPGVMQKVVSRLEKSPEYQWRKREMEEANRLGLYEMAINLEISLSKMQETALAPFTNIRTNSNQTTN